jgi:hypothetical protein
MYVWGLRRSVDGSESITLIQGIAFRTGLGQFQSGTEPFGNF